MIIILSTSLLILFAFTLFLYLKTRKQQKSLITANQLLARIGTGLEESLTNDGETITSPVMRLIVEIHEPIALAKRESMPAQLIGDLIPATITKKVYKQLKKEIQKSLKEKEIDAEIKIETY